MALGQGRNQETGRTESCPLDRDEIRKLLGQSLVSLRQGRHQETGRTESRVLDREAMSSASEYLWWDKINCRSLDSDDIRKLVGQNLVPWT